jgi:L-arabinose isomerase
MQQGYGFAGEGDWKTAALLRIMKVMSTGLQGGTSFMEDYTTTKTQRPGARLAHAGSVSFDRRRGKPILDVQYLASAVKPIRRA